MSQFKRILVCLDLRSDQQALVRRACELARRTGARLTLLHVIEEPPGELHGLVDDAELVRLERMAQADARERLAALADPCTEGGLSIETRCRSGIPFREIVMEAATGHHDLVLVGADHPQTVGQRLFGGTTRRLLRKCPCPLWVVQAGERLPYRRVLAAVELSDDPVRKALDRRIYAVARDAASAEGAELHLVHAVQLEIPPFSTLAGELPELLRQASERARVRMDELSAVFRENHVVRLIHLRRGRPAALIAELAGQIACDVAVLGTIGRTGIPGLLIGNTAEQVLHRLRCSVVAVKPEGFISPVLQS